MLAAARVQPERRESEREEVYFRTRANADGLGQFPVQIVNISANGLMARTDTDVPIGGALSFRLPIVGDVRAEVRWALGGRIGCQFDRMIPLAPYLELLGILVKDAR
jgi:hypothetical protein